MNFTSQYKSKLISISDALNEVKSNFEIVCSLGPCEPSLFLANLHKVKDKVENISVVTMLSLQEYKFNSDPSMKGHFINETTFYGGSARCCHNHGLTSYIPTHLRYAAINRLKYIKPNLFVGAVSPMDKHGFFSLSLSTVYEIESLEAADMVILEVNENLPRVHGDTLVHLSQADYIYENNCPVKEIDIPAVSDKDLTIGRYIASLIPDGATIQLGIGGIPNAVCQSLLNKKDLGVHTEMISEGICDLYNSGVITNRKKTLHRNKIVGSFALGTKKLYDFLNDNVAIELKSCAYTNNPYIIGKNDNMISINTTLAIDLTGQCASESIGYKQYSGTGGQTDTGVGAQLSKGGKSIIALYSTAKNNTISTICAQHYAGAAISFSRNDVDYVVTEYGIANLKGKSIAKRIAELISISHPDFRAALKKDANKYLY